MLSEPTTILKNDLRTNNYKVKMVRPKDPKAYENLLKHYNKGISPHVTCECGKIVQEKQMEKHKQSNTHKYLLYYKEQCEELKKEQSEATVKKMDKSQGNSQWRRICS